MFNSEHFEQNTLLDDPKKTTFWQGLENVTKISADGMVRIVERLNLEGQNIPVRNVPVGGYEGVSDLLDIFDKARQGFRLLSRIDDDDGTINPQKFIEVVGTDKKDDAASLIAEMFPAKKIVQANDEFALSTTYAFINTLRKLAQAEQVTFYHLGIIPSEDDPQLITTPSYWKVNLSSETVWRTIHAVEIATRKAILQKGFIENIPLLYKGAHFFGAGLNLSTIR